MGLLEDLYRETLLEHYQHPRNFGPLLEATLSVGAQNPSCGDRIRLHLQLEGGRIRAIRFGGGGWGEAHPRGVGGGRGARRRGAPPSPPPLEGGPRGGFNGWHG